MTGPDGQSVGHPDSRVRTANQSLANRPDCARNRCASGNRGGGKLIEGCVPVQAELG